MNKRRIAFLLSFILVLLLIFNQNVFAYEREGHDNLTKFILFRNLKHAEGKDNEGIDIIKLDKGKEAFEVLVSAVYLAVDQYRGENDSRSVGQSALDVLNRYGVPGMPKEIRNSDIDLTASVNTHRNYTHRGWDFYGGVQSEKFWGKRKNVLVAAVSTVFDFDGNLKKADSFAAILYYIHIIGDHIDDKTYMMNNGLKIQMGGTINKNENIIDELIKHIKIVFEDQKGTHKYAGLIARLDMYNSKYGKNLVRTEGGINSQEKFELKQEYDKKIMELLSYYLPYMLQKEAFFSKVFY